MNKITTVRVAVPEHEMLTPPTGFGKIPLDEYSAMFRDNGFTLEQVERNSIFDLHGSFDVVERMLEESLTAAGTDYRLVEWLNETP